MGVQAEFEAVLRAQDVVPHVVRVGDQYEYIGPYSAIQQALVEDEDIECVVLTPQFGTRKLQRVHSPQSTTVARGFPDTQAELAAFDAVVGAVPHEEYRTLDGAALATMLRPGGLVADIKGMWRGCALPAGLRHWTL